MEVAIIGAGNVGQALARGCGRAGHAVTIATDHPEDAARIASNLGVAAASMPAVVAVADVIILAVPFDALSALAADLGNALDGKVLIDVTNRFDPLQLDGPSNAELIQTMTPAATIVKAFNTIFASHQDDPRIDGIPLDGFVAGADGPAKQRVLELVGSLGFRPIDAGPLAMARAGGDGAAQHFTQPRQRLAVADRLEVARSDRASGHGRCEVNGRPSDRPAVGLRRIDVNPSVSRTGGVSMLATMARNWWTFVVRGVIAIIFGVLAWFWPAETLFVLVYLFAAYAIVDGVFALIGAFTNGGGGRWVALVIEGILGIIAGIVAFVWPGLTAVALLYVIAAWAILTGIFEIIEAIRLRHEITNEFWLGLAGVLSIVFGVVIALFPGPGMLSLVWLLGVYAIVFGIFMIAVGIRLHGYHGVSGPPMTGQPAGA